VPFEKSEYLERIGKTKKSMADQGVDVLLATNPANMNYLTGYDGWSFYVHQLVALTLDSDEPIWIGRGMDANAAKVTTFLNHDNILDIPTIMYRHPLNIPWTMLPIFSSNTVGTRAPSGLKWTVIILRLRATNR